MAAIILIADDDPVQRRLVENMVQKCGYETIVADSGDAAMAKLAGPDAVAIDAVVLDLVMPGLDGMGVLDRIREAGVAIPVIVQQLLPGNLRVPISPVSVVVAFLVSCSTGLFFGYLPASQAARLEPVESLRYE